MPRRSIIFLFSSLLAMAGDLTNPVTYGRAYGNSPLPAYDKGYLLFTSRPNTVEAWGPEGRLVFRTQIADPPGASVMSAAIDTDGTVAVSVAYPVGAPGFGGGVVLLDRAGKPIRLIETGRYMPAHLSFDQGHSLWAFGWQRDLTRNEIEDTGEYMLFRKYSLAGKQLGAYVPRSRFPRPGLSPGGAQGGLWRLRAVGDRIGALAYSGPSSSTFEWIELDLHGGLIGQWKLGGDSDAGWAFVRGVGLCRLTQKGVERFETGTATWKPLAALDKRLGILLGADGDQLVFGHSEGTIHLTRVPATLP